MSSAVDPKNVVHRSLRFSNLDELARELDLLEQAASAGKLRCTGNWSAGQCFGHLAGWINYGYEGFPMQPPPWPIRFILRRLGRRYIRKGMPRAVRIPGAASGTWATEPLDTETGLSRLRAALARLKSGEPARFHSPGFGPMSHADRTALMIRHCELHLGYLHPE
jgi:hypothetical protein